MSINANRVLYAIFKAISVEPTKEELQFVIDVINGGKTDNTERASTICGYFDKQGNEKAFCIRSKRHVSIGDGMFRFLNG